MDNIPEKFDNMGTQALLIERDNLREELKYLSDAMDTIDFLYNKAEKEFDYIERKFLPIT